MATYDLFEPELKHVKFKVERTATGQWRSHESLDGKKFKEFISDREIFGMPLVHIANGVDPRTEKQAIAKGFVAIGQRAQGVIAIGQLASGYIAIGQAALGRVVAVGQAAVAPISVGQFSVGAFMVGQMIYGGWGVGQVGTVIGGFGMQITQLGQMFGF